MIKIERYETTAELQFAACVWSAIFGAVIWVLVGHFASDFMFYGMPFYAWLRRAVLVVFWVGIPGALFLDYILNCIYRGMLRLR